MSKRFSKESVDIIYKNTKQVSYSEGFRDGYEKCKQDIVKMLKEK